MSKVILIGTKRFGDSRGWFAETYNAARFAALGITDVFVQDNHSYSANCKTLRGLHYQMPPHAQAKLVRCTRGCVMDYAVDVRAGSPTYGKWVTAELSAANGKQLYIPVGYAHAFLTLEPESEVTYKVSSAYAPEADGGLRWDDPMIAINWPLDGGAPVLSDKDAVLPFLGEFDSPFVYDGTPMELVTA